LLLCEKSPCLYLILEPKPTFMKSTHAKSLLLILLLTPFSLLAQQPILKLKGGDSASVLLTHLKTEVKVIGNYAVTTMEMVFCNSTDRVLEGELIFPMPDGVTISRYAIDINGRMREAVPVEKEKGQVVFENIVRQKVDPGLLEKVDGNNFRTRIYPIPANGCRTVLIGYEQLLSLNSNYAFVYSLPLHFKEPIKQFDFSITVASNYIPEVGSDCNTNLKFEELNKVFTSSVSKQNFKPDGAFTINVPKTADATEISMQSVNGQYYFLLNTFPQVKKIEKKIPDVITVIWDASLSGMNRDHKKEIELLDAYIKAKKNLTINLFTAAIDLKKINTYSISKGNWNDMRKTLEDIDYDGASNLSSIANLPAADEYLFFTDGLHNWGSIDNIELPKRSVYTICAAATANYSLLKYIAAATGGSFINLNETDIATAQKYLTEQTLQFLGIKPAAGITEVYPSVATPLVNGCSIAGISNTGSAGIFLQYGYGSTVTFEQYLDINFNAHNTRFINIEKIWAQKKIAELDIQYDRNKETITALGKKYSVITRSTSLIVLDAVEDYVRYDIEPPAELMEAYTSLITKKRSVAIEKEKDVLAEARRHFVIVQSWWDKDFKPGAKIKKDVKVPSMPQATTAPVSDSLVVIGYGTSNYTQQGEIYFAATRSLRPDEAVNTTMLRDRTPLPNENISSAPASRSSGAPVPDTDADGVNDEEDKCINERGPTSNFGCPVISEEVIKRVNLAAKNVYFEKNSAKLKSSLNSGKRSNRSVSGRNTAATVVPPPPPPPAEPKKEENRKLLTYAWTDAGTSSEINSTELIPDRPYLKELDSLAKEDRYKKYLELRKGNNTPTFYFDMANMFFRDADTATGYRILSNIAELNLDDHESCKMLGYRLKSMKRYADEVMIFRKVMQLRPQDPQSYRDYALALADVGKFQQALDTLYLSFTKKYDQQIKDLYPGIEEIILTEINELIAVHGGQLNTLKIPAELIKQMPVDVRVVINWNMNDTDVDLWVIDPNGEKCYYSHRDTEIGGRISRDFTRGYGPEHFMLKNTIKGKYQVMVHYYGNTRQRIAGATSVMAEIFTHYATTSMQRKVVALQTEGKGSNAILIAEFSF
jgi:tetratricopeptide (TPR) repeat protein